MATESTAIVNLVDLVKTKPLPKGVGDDRLFGGGAAFDPLAMEVPAAASVTLPTAPTRTPSGTKPPAIASSQQLPSVVLPGPFVRQPAHAIERTIRVPRSVDPNVKKFALPVGLFVVAMILLSIYLAKGDKKAPKAAVVHAPAPAVTVPDLTPPPAPAPVAAPVVAAKTEPVVTPIASPTVEPIDPPAAAQPTVPTVPAPTVPTVPAPTVPTVPAPTVPTVPDPTVATTEDAPAPAAVPAKASKHHREHHRAAKRAKTETRVAVADAPKPAAVEKNLRGKGALVLSSSPAREVWIDGRTTKQLTPQRLTLAPGTHNVTLFDKKTRSAKTFQVEIKPNQTLKVAKSY